MFIIPNVNTSVLAIPPVLELNLLIETKNPSYGTWGKCYYSKGVSEHIYIEKDTVQKYYSWFTSFPTTKEDHDHPTFVLKTQTLVLVDDL